MTFTPEEAAMKRNFLKQRQSLPLHLKVELSKNRIKQFYEHFDGNVYVSFSGGKDSTVLLHLVRSLLLFLSTQDLNILKLENLSNKLQTQ